MDTLIILLSVNIFYYSIVIITLLVVIDNSYRKIEQSCQNIEISKLAAATAWITPAKLAIESS